MTEDETIELLDELPHVEPETQQPQPTKTKLDQFIDALSQYPNIDEAKTHIKDIAKDLECAPSLGYKAIKRMKKRGLGFAAGAKPQIEPKEATLKIPEVETEEIPETPEEPETIIVEEEQPTASTPEVIAPNDTMAKIMPIFERSIGRLFNQGIELLSGSKEVLSEQEAKDTAVLLPIIIFRLTKTELNEDQFIDATCITHFGAIVLRVVKTKIKEYKQRKKEEKEKPVAVPPPAAAQPETPKEEQPKEPTEAELDAKKREQKPSFLKKI